MNKNKEFGLAVVSQVLEASLNVSKSVDGRNVGQVCPVEFLG